jgi:site-specific recombinase XerD
MLESYLTDPAAIERRRTGLFGAHMDSFVTSLAELGYSRGTVRQRLWLLNDFEQWLKRKRLVVTDLQEAVMKRFLERQRRAGRLHLGGLRIMRQFLEHLRDKGAIPRRLEPPTDVSPLAMLQKRYENFLRKERGLSPSTIGGYWRFIRLLLVERFGEGPIYLRRLAPGDISDFVLQYTRSGPPSAPIMLVPALRSFFRFLFQYGETERNLAGAVPTVARWRLAGVPKYLEPDDVERVIQSCNRSTPVGCRDYAILLLLARLGLRAGEVIALELDDIDWRTGVLMVRGKGHYHDQFPLPHDVGEAIAIYLRQGRPPCTTRRVFVRGRPPYRSLTNPSTLSTLVRYALKRAGLEPSLKGAHLLRHSLATGMLRRGASMAEIGQILRHRSPNTTEIYAKVDLTNLRSLALSWPGKGGVQ